MRGSRSSRGNERRRERIVEDEQLQLDREAEHVGCHSARGQHSRGKGAGYARRGSMSRSRRRAEPTTQQLSLPPFSRLAGCIGFAVVVRARRSGRQSLEGSVQAPTPALPPPRTPHLRSPTPTFETAQPVQTAKVKATTAHRQCCPPRRTCATASQSCAPLASCTSSVNSRVRPTRTAPRSTPPKSNSA